MTAKEDLIAYFGGDEHHAKAAMNYCRLMTQTMARDIGMELTDALDYMERSLSDGTIETSDEEKVAILLVIKVIREDCET